MRLRTWAEIIGTIISLGGLFFTRAKWLADIFGIFHLPNDVRELLTKASETPLRIIYGLLCIGLVCVAFLIHDTLFPSKKDRELKFNRANRMIPFIGMIVFGTGFLVCAAWYLWLEPIKPADLIEWGHGGSPFGLEVEARMEKRGGPVVVSIYGLAFNGRNISGCKIYQIDASFTVDRSKQTFPLYVIADGQWILPRDANGIPVDAAFTIGCQTRGDTLHCGNFTREMTPDEFFMDIGAFTFEFVYDGKKFVRHFSVEELEQQVAAFKAKTEEDWKKMPLAQPSVTKRNP